MKKAFLLILLFCGLFTSAQVINKAEYYIDTDPGQSNGTIIPPFMSGQTINFNASVPTLGLTSGFHNLFIRTRLSNGIWSQSESRLFFISDLTSNAANIKSAEYFIDADPGVGRGTSLNIGNASNAVSFAATIPTNLPSGFHNLSVRVQNISGGWGIAEVRMFYISEQTTAAANIVTAEYFLDTDPGVGAGTALNVGASGASISFKAAIASGNLSNGFHNLSIRTKNSSGGWGIYETRVFYISNQGLPAADITAAEYFIDADPGIGSAKPLAISTPGSTVNIVADIPTTGLASGSHYLFIRAKSADGWGAFEQREFTISNAAAVPNKPIILSVNNSNSSPVLSKRNKPVIIGTADASASIDVFSGTDLLGTVTTDAQGKWTLSVVNPLPDGQHLITAKAKNAANVQGPASDIFTLNIDTQSPAKPILVKVDGSTVSPMNSSNNKPVIEGTSEASSVVEIFNGATSIGTTITSTSGNFVFTPASAVPDGNYMFSVKATDTAGNISAVSNVFNLIIDTQGLNAPIITSAAGNTTQDAVTTDNTPAIIGTSEAGSVVEIFNNSTSLGGVTANASGSFDFTPLVSLPDGNYVFTAKAKDASNNVSPVSAGFNLIIDTKAPAVAVIESIDGKSSAGFTTANNKPSILGTSEAGSTVELFNGSQSIAIVITDASGHFSFTPSNALPDGAYAINTKTKDAAGNISAASPNFNFSVDTQGLPAPIITSVAGADKQGAITSDNKPAIIGTSKAGSAVEIFNGLTSLGSVTASATGSFNFTPLVSLPDGNYIITAKAKNAANNISPLSAGFNIIIDSQAPAIAVIESIDGKSSAGFTTANNKPSIIGTSEAASTVELFNGSQNIGSVVADAFGHFSFTPSNALQDGTYFIKTKAKDAAGNVSAESPNFNFTVDTQAPAAPNILSVNGNSIPGSTISNNKPPISGTAEAGSTLELFDGSVSLGVSTVDATGNFSFTPGSALPDGNYALTANSRDKAGNLSPFSKNFSFVVDTQCPPPPIVVSVDGHNIPGFTTSVSKSVIVGTAEPNSVAEFFNGAISLGTVITDASGIFRFTPANNLPSGIYSLTVKVKDAVGNVSAGSDPFDFTIVPANPELNANNILTPNGDGKNDFLIIKNIEYYTDNTLTILDRAGRVVYSTRGYKNDWGGELNGSLLAEDTYYLIVTTESRKLTWKSFITIIRKTSR